jgi:hypothetical protein
MIKRGEKELNEMQLFYDDDHTQSDIAKKFGVGSLRWGMRNGLVFRPRNTPTNKTLKLREIVKDINYSHCCDWCKIDFSGRRRGILKFCSARCATMFQMHNPASRTKMKPVWEKQIKTKQTSYCLECGSVFTVLKSRKKYCSRACSGASTIRRKNIGRLGGLASVAAQNRRSKNEILFFDSISKSFNATPNKILFGKYDCDVFLDDFNVAIMWDGMWHFKKMGVRHNLEGVKRRDEYKIRKMVEAGIKPYIISDFGSYDQNFVTLKVEEVTNWVYSKFPFAERFSTPQKK